MAISHTARRRRWAHAVTPLPSGTIREALAGLAAFACFCALAVAWACL